MKAKKLTQIEAIRSARKVWGFKPVTRIVDSKKKYNRKDKTWRDGRVD